MFIICSIKMDSTANFGKFTPTPSPIPYIPPAPIPIVVKNPYNVEAFRYIYAFKTNQPNGGGSMADQWNKIMDELEKVDHPRTKEKFYAFSLRSWGTSRFSPDFSDNQNTAIQVAGEVLSWIKAGGDNASCSQCPAKSDRLTNFKRPPRIMIFGNPPTMNICDDVNEKLVCTDCYEKEKQKADLFLKKQSKKQRETAIKKHIDYELNNCTCAPPLSQCGNCLRKMRQAYKNDPRPECEKCHSKETTMLQFGERYHRTCDDCIQDFEADIYC